MVSEGHPTLSLLLGCGQAQESDFSQVIALGACLSHAHYFDLNQPLHLLSLLSFFVDRESKDCLIVVSGSLSFFLSLFCLFPLISFLLFLFLFPAKTT